jgi:hypothetical protein
VDELGLSEEDWQRVAAAYCHFRVGADTPVYLREFLARRLEVDGCAGLAARVRGFRGGEMEALWQRLRGGH